MTPQELKNSILQLAIQGKLVEQREEEGTAEELYKQIQDEKQKLIKEGKIKKQKVLPEITKDEIPFDIPVNWIWVRTGDIGSWSSGATPSRSNPAYYGGNIPWLKTGDLNDGIVTEVPEMITELALKKTSIRLNPVGCVLMAMYGATIGKLCINAIPLTTNQACCACICFDGIYNKYLFFYLMAVRRNFIGMAEGGAQPNISKEKIVNSVFPLPPLEEQIRIVAKIEELLPYIDKYEKAWTKLEEFNKKFPDDMQKSILQTAIQGKLVEQRAEEGTAEELYKQIQEEKQRLIKEGKIKKQKALPEIAEDEIPFDIPDSWKWCYLGDIFNHISGKALNAKNTKGSKHKYITTSNVYWDHFELDNLKEMYYTDDEIEKYSLKINDLLVLEGGDVGRTAIWNRHESYCIQNHIHRLRPYINVCIEFYYYTMMYLKNTGAITGKGIGIKGLSAGALHSIVIPIPPLEEQKRIVAKIEELLPLCERLK